MKRIVLVEDDAPIRDVIAIAFADDQCEIILLENGNVILNDELEAPDLFLLDKQISGTDGLVLCRFIKNHEKYKHVPVLMISANPYIDALAKDAGADGAVSKPFSLKQLRDIVFQYLEK